MLFFLGKRQQISTQIVKYYGSSKTLRFFSTIAFLVRKGPLGSSPNRAMQVCDAMYFCSPRCESHDVRALDGTETSDLCSAMCIAKTSFAMRYVFIAICTLTLEIHCDVGLGTTPPPLQRSPGPFGPEMRKKSSKTSPGPPAPSWESLNGGSQMGA